MRMASSLKSVSNGKHDASTKTDDVNKAKKIFSIQQSAISRYRECPFRSEDWNTAGYQPASGARAKRLVVTLKYAASLLSNLPSIFVLNNVFVDGINIFYVYSVSSCVSFLKMFM